MTGDDDILTKDDLEKINPDAPLPELARNTLTDTDKNRARLLMQKLGNPVELQQMAAVEIRMAVDQMIADDIAQFGRLSEKTLEWLVKHTEVLNSVHKNLYGSKSVNLNVEGKISHAQIATMMRQAMHEDRVVDVTPKEDDGGV